MNPWTDLMKTNEADFFNALGKRIATLRKQQGYTQLQLADLLGLKQYVVASYETGRRRPSAALIPELAGALGVTIEELIGLDSAKRKPGPTPKLQQQIEQLQRLPKPKQKFVSEFLDTVLQQG
jgi:transcriptional regulator with XRE-family HTH domain